MEALLKSNYRVFLILLISLLYSPMNVNGECNVCSAANNLACVSDTQFQVCITGYPSGPVNSCPSGYVCSTVNATICQPNQADVVRACNECNQCDETNTFACTGLRTFALCLGTTVPSVDITGSCAPNHVCNVHYPQICGNATTGIPPTCASVGESTTTVAPPTTSAPVADPVTYCRRIQQVGRFPAGTDINTTCKQYIYCFVHGGVWSGALYNCPGNTYFNSSTRLCERNVPARCTGAVWSLAIQGMRLL